MGDQNNRKSGRPRGSAPPARSGFASPVVVVAAMLALLLGACSPGNSVRTSASPTASAPGNGSGTGDAGAPTGPPSSSATPTGTPSPTLTPVPSPPPDCSKVKCIALTFDDGPSPETTPELLDTLEREKATATMFLMGGPARDNPDLVRREQAMGLEIGNHTMTHPTLSNESDATVRRELEQTQQILTGITGQTPHLMRPPYAARTKRTDAVSRELGLSVITWHDSPQDWVNHDAATVARLTVSKARPGEVVLMHDPHQWTVDAVAKIIPQLREQGYVFVTVTQLLGPTSPGEVYPKQ